MNEQSYKNQIQRERLFRILFAKVHRVERETLQRVLKAEGLCKTSNIFQLKILIRIQLSC